MGRERNLGSLGEGVSEAMHRAESVMGLIDFESNAPPKPWSRQFSLEFAGTLLASEALELEKRATQELCRLRVTLRGGAPTLEEEFRLALSFQAFLLHVVHRILAESGSNLEIDRIAQSMALTLAEICQRLWADYEGESSTPAILEVYTRAANSLKGFPLTQSPPLEGRANPNSRDDVAFSFSRMVVRQLGLDTLGPRIVGSAAYHVSAVALASQTEIGCALGRILDRLKTNFE
jgi:hypothetical protein